MSSLPDQGLRPDYADMHEHRGWFSALGLILIFLGIIAIVAAFAATLATVMFFGAVLLMAGVIQIAHALASTRWRAFAVHLLGGLLYAVIGGTLVVDPVEGAIGLTILLAAFFMAGGFLKMLGGILAESGWFAFSGVIDLVLGLLIAAGWPATGTWVIGLFVGIELIFAGTSLLAVASGMRPSPERYA